MSAGGDALARISSYVDAHWNLLDTPGLALCATDAERTLGVLNRGHASLEAGTPVDERHRFQIGSISKGFTAMALLRRWEAGRLDLDAPITDHLPWFEVRSAYGPITVHHLLSHTAGIVCGIDATGEAAHEVWSLRDTIAAWPPGERFSYSNVGYKTLGLVLSAVATRPWWDVVRAEVMEPIGMGDADVVITNETRERLAIGYTSPLDDRPWLPRHGWAPSTWFESATADGTICATAEELARYARLLLNRGHGVLGAEGFERMTRPVAVDPASPEEVFGYGLKWVPGLDGRRLLGHSGGMVGFTAYLLVDPEAGVGVVALMNSALGGRFELVRFAVACLAAQAEGRELPEVPEPAERANVPDAPSYTGTFEDDAGRVQVLADARGLVLEEGERRSRLVPIGDGRFAVDDAERDRYGLEIVREDGRPTALRWGPRWLPGPGSGPGSQPSEEDRTIAGRYRSWNPWAPGFDVFARRDGLWLELFGATDDEASRPLERLPDGTFSVGVPPTPSRIRFDTPIDGRPTRAWLDAAPFYRAIGP